jgi:putative alpha-1,2-mannosidase
MRVNGKEYTRNYLTHDALTKGATIKLQMNNTPNRSRGTADEDAPYSFSKE